MFSVNVLLYGDHPELATRCLRSIVNTADWSKVAEVRIGLNAVSSATRQIALAVAESTPVVCHVYEEEDGRNVWKYPMMRRMLRDAQRPVQAPHVMWFDDDSYVTAGREWWGRVSDLADRFPLVGSRYRLKSGYRPGQVEGIKAQLWYAGQPFGKQPLFVTGGWWVLQTPILSRHDYPFPVLKHNGGDSILGELCRQQGYEMKHFNEGIAINADAKGKESAATRRGDSTAWPWEGYRPGQEQDYSHHNFGVRVRTFLRVQDTTEGDSGPPAKPEPALTLPPPQLIKLPGF